ncbi:hypothetical protein K458DRAFT_397350 [Lentithecium fluviatile CBS 122367]|uniref:Uncharacterized protein n=1 Tax=Lentithecium fluviatile CBS 122367 TaxID=1168545 RepID=A0A6G1IDN7_9PLEO|nr:hypothetical protein K458DRAFT_397350 [Lentithecium fluviatile CBS 122367]
MVSHALHHLVYDAASRLPHALTPPFCLTNAELHPAAPFNISWRLRNPLRGFYIFLTSQLTCISENHRIALIFELDKVGWPIHLRSMHTAGMKLVPGSEWSVEDYRALVVLRRGFGLEGRWIAGVFFEGRTVGEVEGKLREVLGDGEGMGMRKDRGKMGVEGHIDISDEEAASEDEGEYADGDDEHSTDEDGDGGFDEEMSTTLTPSNTHTHPPSSNTNPPPKTPAPISTAPNPAPTLQQHRNSVIQSISRSHIGRGTRVRLKNALDKRGWPKRFTSLANFHAPPARKGEAWAAEDSRALLYIREVAFKIPHCVLAEKFFWGRSEGAVRSHWSNLVAGEKKEKGNGGIGDG